MRLLPELGNGVEVLGFPDASASVPQLSECLLRLTGSSEALKPRKLALDELVTGAYGGSLVQLEANLLSAKARGTSQVLELQAS